MPYVAVNGVDHYYEWICEAGSHPSDKPGKTGKPVMVFVHGWAGSARYWQSTAQAISDDFDCLLYDLRGFGRSKAATPDAMAANPDLINLESFAEDLKELLDALNLKSVFLNAHSLGGSVGLYFLERYPNYVEKAILTCNGSFEYDKLSFDAFHKFGGYVVSFRPQWLRKVPLAPTFFMSRFLKRSIPYAEKKAFLDDFLIADEATAMGTMRTAVSKHATEAIPKAYEALQVPTLLISGQHDKIIPAKLGKQAATLSSQVEYVVIDKTAHFPMLEDADTYLRTVSDFLGKPVAVYQH